MKVIVNNRQKKVKLPRGLTVRLKKVLQEAHSLYDLPENCEVSVSYVDNAMIRTLNSEYRGIDKETDVLSFAMLEGDEFPAGAEQPALLGDIVLSLEKAVAQASEYNHSLEREMAYLVVHGFLHLIGYDHLNAKDKAQMRENEEYILEKLELTRKSD